MVCGRSRGALYRLYAADLAGREEERTLQSVVPLLNSLQQSWLAVSIAESSWAFPAIEMVHVIALTLTIGTVLVVDLRLLGLASIKQRYQALRRDVLPWTWLAFCAAVASGCLMFISQATEYYENDAFRVKLVLLLLAGINMLVFELIIARGAAVWDHGTPVPRAGKIAALLSLALWIAIVYFGRRVGFTMDLGRN
jgi:hypothetical protein